MLGLKIKSCEVFLGLNGRFFTDRGGKGTGDSDLKGALRGHRCCLTPIVSKLLTLFGIPIDRPVKEKGGIKE